eukprot:940695-Lingulodinium_polyedra.AAC.1
MYVGIVRSARSSNGFRNIEKVQWQKSHVKLEKLEGAAWLVARSNEVADQVANWAVKLHPAWSKDSLE